MSEQDGNRSQSDTNMPPGGPLPLPTLDHIKVNSFTLTPSAIKGGETVTVSWSTTVPATLGGVVFHLNGLTVRSSGSEAFRPVVDTRYQLSATRYGVTRYLASQVLTVDRGPCSLPGPAQPVAHLEFFVQTGVFDVFRPEKNYTIEKAGAKIHVVEQAIGNTTFELEPDTGLFKLTIPLTVTIEHIDGEGSLDARVWFRFVAQGGRVVPLVEKTATDLSLPWGIWLAALMALLGPGGFTVAALLVTTLNELAPQLASGEITSSIGPLTELISQQFGDRVSSVSSAMQSRFPGDPPEPFVVTLVCP